MKFSRINLLLGPPGSGKTYSAERFAQQRNAKALFYQCHAWTDADELFVGVNIQAAVAGEAEKVWQEGVLAQTARFTAAGQEVVLILDELDKAPERVEALLLDFLQSGRVPIKPGEHLIADLDLLWVFITSNQVRTHSGALMRRCKRFFLEQMRPERIAQILEAQGYNRGLALQMARIGAWIAGVEGNEDGISLQEVRNLLEELEDINSLDEFKELIISWFCRTEKGAATVRNHDKITNLWGVTKSLW